VLLLLSSAGPAAAEPPVITFASPSADQRYPAPAAHLDVTVTMNNGTLRGDVVVTWSGPAGAPVPAEYRHATGNSAGTVQIVRSNQPFPWNGAYAVTVQATGRRSGVFSNPDESNTATRPFVVDAPPAPPTGLTTAVDGGARTVDVTWSPNTEAQLVGYEVQRQLGSSPWARVTVTDASTTSVVDEGTADAGGTYRYRVVAFRHSADAGQLLASAPSGTSSAKVPAPPVTTTTTTTTTTSVGTGTGQGSGSQRSTTSRTGSGTASTSSGSGSAGSGSGAGTSGSSSSVLANAGKVDLSGFTSLLEQARQAGQVPSGTTATTEPDGGFDEKLPFAARPRSGGDTEEMTLLDETPLAGDDGDDVQSPAFLAGGLLVTVVVMFLLWVQSQVRKVEILEPVSPQEPPARPRRRRPPPSAWERFGAEPDDLATQAQEAATVG
jgi:hypothetical protein